MLPVSLAAARQATPRAPTHPGTGPGAAHADPQAVLDAVRAHQDAHAGRRRATLRYAAAALAAIALAWLTYSRHGWIPILSGADLGVHEFGHLLTFWAPALLCSFAGSFLQVAAPLGLAAYFWRRREGFAVVLMVAWAAESLNNVSVYVGDAQRMVLPLFGDDGSGAGHDWHNILARLGLLPQTDLLAALARAGSVALFAAALGLAALGMWQARRAADRRGA